MNLFGKIYSAVLVLYIIVVAALTLHVTQQRVTETEFLLGEKYRVTGAMATSEIQRWHAQGMWPFEALREISGMSGFLFWWIGNDDGEIHLADKSE